MSEEDYYYEKLGSAISSTPESMAKELFSKDPGDPCTNCILPMTEKYTEDNMTFIFEILITIYAEGFMNILDMRKNNNIKDVYENCSMNDLLFLDPWFKSMGFTIQVTEINKKNYNKIRGKSYCRIALAFDSQDMSLFLFKKISKRYHFLLNKDYEPTDKLENIYAILNKSGKSYKISFKNFIL